MEEGKEVGATMKDKIKEFLPLLLLKGTVFLAIVGFILTLCE